MRPVNSRLYCEYKPAYSSSSSKVPTRQSSSHSISNKVQQVHPISESSCETKSKDSVVSICKSVSYSCLSRLSFLSPFGGNGCISEPSLNLAPISGNSEERGSGATSMGAVASTMPSAAKRKAFSDLPESPRSNGPENGDISSSPNPIRAERHIENIGCSAEEALKQVAAAKVAVVHCSENISQFESLVSSASSEITVTAIRVSEAAKKIIQDVTLLQQWPIAYVKGDPVGNEEALKKIADSGVLAEWLKDHTYDLIVIGGGSGGLAAAKEAARLGKKVACLDFVKPSPQGTTWGLGGTCVNVGCIPKKLMHQASILGHSIKDAEKFGWTLPEGAVTHSWTKMKGAIQDHIASLNWGYRVQLREKTVTYVNSYGTFTGPFEISATNKKGKVEKLTANRFLVSTGLRPKYPEIPGAKEYTISSDDLFSLPYAPGKTLCVGASYVSLECAGFLHGVGFDVTVMVRSILLRGFDQDIAERIRKHMIEYGVKFESGVPSRIEQLEAKTADKPGLLRVFWEKTAEDGTKKEVSEDYNTVLMAIGREAATNDCGLDLVGVTRSKTGKLVGRREQSVSCPYVYAIGDVLENTPELTPVAIQAGKVLMRRLYEGTREVTEYDQIPTTVFTPLEYGCCGLAEEDALKKYGKDNVIIYHAAFLPLEYTVAERMDKEHCYCKLICLKNENERVVGYHILTPWAGEVTQGFAIALKLGGTKADFDRLIGIHPTVAENFTTLTNVKQEGVELKASGC